MIFRFRCNGFGSILVFEIEGWLVWVIVDLMVSGKNIMELEWCLRISFGGSEYKEYKNRIVRIDNLEGIGIRLYFFDFIGIKFFSWVLVNVKFEVD